jgi:DNA-binding beta-propeller fold protein YncE
MGVLEGRVSVRWVAVLVAALGLFGLAVPADANGGEGGGNLEGPPPGSPRDVPHEVWMLDQGTDRIHVFDDDRREIAAIDVSREALAPLGYDWNSNGPVVPHMIDFDSQYRYAFIAATAGAATIVVDAAEKEVISVLPTGGGSHMAAVTPDDDAVWVAAIGARQLVRVALDLDAGPPTADDVDRRLPVEDLLATFAEESGTSYEWTSYSPVCHQYVADTNEAWVTLGPGPTQGGLFVFDLDAEEVTHAYDPAEVKANCGVAVTADDSRVIANWSGTLHDADGRWYAFDARTKEQLQDLPSAGVDAHGVRLTPDGRHLWMVNRGSDDGLIIDARTLRTVRELDDVGDAPDILDFSPDGRWAYVTQRGPNPLSGAIHVATGSRPGIAVLHVPSGRVVDHLEPPRVEDGSGVRNDVHGVAVRPAVDRPESSSPSAQPRDERRPGVRASAR